MPNCKNSSVVDFARVVLLRNERARSGGCPKLGQAKKRKKTIQDILFDFGEASLCCFVLQFDVFFVFLCVCCFFFFYVLKGRISKREANSK